jgi:hypothetical protein
MDGLGASISGPGLLLVAVACGTLGSSVAVPVQHGFSPSDAVNSSGNPNCKPQFAASSLQIAVDGAVEPVWLYANSHAEPDNLPDFHPVAYRSADGQVHLSITHFENYRISGGSLDSLTQTEKTFDSDGPLHSAQWGDFGHHQWVASPFTNDGTTFFALAHSEWYACLQYGNDPVKGCTVGNNQVNSWVNAITLFQSSDGGRTWSPSGGNNGAHVVAAPSMEYPSDWQFWTFPQMRNYGFFHPSNIVEQNSYFYATAGYIHRTASNVVDSVGAVLIRTSSLSSAKGWTVWDGGSYVPISASWDDTVPVLANVPADDGIMSTIAWSTSVCQYIILFTGSSGVQFATTPSLESPQLSQVQSIQGGGGFADQNYPILQDDSFPSFNFHALLSDAAYLYSVRQNGGLSRDVIKQKVTLSSSSGPTPPRPPPPGPPPPGPPPKATHPNYTGVK